MTPQRPLSLEILLNPKLTDFLDLQIMDFTELNYKNITEKDKKLEDYNKYI